MTSFEERVREHGIIAVMRGDFPLDRIPAIAGAVGDGGVGIVEITLNSTNALESIGRMRRELGDRLMIGAGTVRTAGDAEAAIDAGAEFLVAPNFDLASVDRAEAAGIPYLPGVFTASEAQAAFAAGCRLVKLFPLDSVGPGYLKALRAPLNDIGFIAVGGIDAGNLGSYIRAGAVAVGVGSSLIRSADEDLSRLRARAEQLVEALRQARESA